MNIQGMGLFILAWAIILLFFAIYPFFGKKLLKIRWTWIAIGSFMFIYYLAARVIPCFIELAHPIKLYNGEQQTLTNSLFSNVLMLDMCPMMAFTMPLLAIFEKKRRVLSCIAPIAFFAGFLSIFGGVFNDFDGGWTANNPYHDGLVVHFDAKYIFIGNAQDHLFFMMHIFIITLGLMTMLSTERKIWISLVGGLGCTCLMASYAAILAYSLNVKSHAFGTVWGDWKDPEGEFSAVTHIVGNDLAVPTGFLLGALIVMLNVVIFFWIRRITIHLFIKKTIKFKPFGEIGNVSLTKKSEIKKMWKINYRFQ